MAKSFKILSLFIIAAMFILPSPVIGQIERVESDTCDNLGITCTGTDDESDLVKYIEDIVNIALALLAVIAAAVLVYGGFIYISSLGDEDQAKKAKKLVLYAILGLLLIGAAALITNVVIGIFAPGP